MKHLALFAAAMVALSPVAAQDFSVGPQYDSTHVYVAPADFDRFIASFVATFGGTTSKQGVFQVTPTASQTMSQVVLSPVGIISVFGFKTPVPYPFGVERTGYLVTDLDAAVAAAKASGATTLVEPFADPIGRDALITWPGGVGLQLYWHTIKPSYAPLATVPENRIYLTRAAADAFVAAWLRFSHGQILFDDAAASGALIGRPDTKVRQIRINSGFGKMLVLASDGALPWPYGHDVTGYEVADLAATIAKAKAAGAAVLVETRRIDDRLEAIVQFPGGYIAEIHQAVPKG
jgi:predicted enzyme related to lactoylglutathione lyase